MAKNKTKYFTRQFHHIKLPQLQSTLLSRAQQDYHKLRYEQTGPLTMSVGLRNSMCGITAVSLDFSVAK